MAPILVDFDQRLQIAGIAPSTSKSYLRAVRDLSLHAGRSPVDLEIEDILDHLAHYKASRKIGSSTMNTRICGIRFYYREVLGRLDMDFYIPNPSRRVKPLSEVMTQSEVRKILTACMGNEKHRAIFMLLYSSGMRLSEVCALQLSDIDSQNMQIRISQGKGKKDRYTVLSQVCLNQLRRYYSRAKPQGNWLFNGQRKGQPMHRRSVQHALLSVLKRTSITKHINVHTFRHTFAVHFLQGGGHLLQLQQLLGHAQLSTTLTYLQHTKLEFSAPLSPLDLWYKPEGQG